VSLLSANVLGKDPTFLQQLVRAICCDHAAIVVKIACW